MIRKIILLTFIAFGLSQIYDVGETMSINHQNQSHSVCYGETDYGSSSTLKFADYNGDLNGGDYHVMLVDMSASW